MRKWLGLLCMTTSILQGAESLTVHEWGTFTCLHDADGEAIGGLNTDEETLPAFVHEMMPGLMVDQPWKHDRQSKAAPVTRAHPSVTMRLETPVVYFYLPQGVKQRVLDMEVRFNGGWLSQFYPKALIEAPGAVDARALSYQSSSKLLWKGLKIGGKMNGIATDSPLWLSPRVAASDSVENREGERERYVFYRGLGQLNSPLRIHRENGFLATHWDRDGVNDPSKSPPIWLLDVKADRRCAFRRWNNRTSAFFSPGAYGTGHLSRLRAEMESELVREGLYPDEAKAMLKTWELSYFRSPGTRVFYLVPPEWVEERLPLKLSFPAAVTRVMVGRIELYTEAQENTLKQLSSTRFDQPFTDKTMPAAYGELGRFRQALVLHYQRKQPTPELERFITLNQL
jgi:hypothetical protein